MNDEKDFILTDEDGNDVAFQLMDFFEFEDKLYAIFTPTDEADNSDEVGVVIMKTEMVNEEPIFEMLEDEDLCQNVLDAYIEMVDATEDSE